MALSPRLAVLVADAAIEDVTAGCGGPRPVTQGLATLAPSPFGNMPVDDDGAARSPQPSEAVEHSSRHDLDRRSLHPPGQDIRCPSAVRRTSATGFACEVIVSSSSHVRSLVCADRRGRKETAI